MSPGSTINFFTLIIVGIILLRNFPLTKQAKIPRGYTESTFLNFTETTVKNEYKSEEHTIITEDGYMLTTFRITKGKNCDQPKKKRPVLIMHGLLLNSDSFLAAGPSAGLAYLLSDACYDVWVGNQRGNNYARKHVWLNPDKDVDFWQFSVDEVGFYDTPATIDYILQKTGADKLNYIGFSQGCTAFFVMCSERPKYCKKAAVMIALAPAVIFDHTESFVFKSILNFALFFQGYLEKNGFYEFFGNGSFDQRFLFNLCQYTGLPWIEVVCGSGSFVDDYLLGSMTSDTQRVIFSHYLVGTSLYNLVRSGQILHSGKFQKLDYGEKNNLERYNRTQPPEYKLNAVSTPVVIIQGRNDKLVSIIDTKVVANKLPNVLELVEVSDSKWTHLDMIYNRNIKIMIYPKVNEYLEKYSNYTRN